MLFNSRLNVPYLKAGQDGGDHASFLLSPIEGCPFSILLSQPYIVITNRKAAQQSHLFNPFILSPVEFWFKSKSEARDEEVYTC